MPRSEICSRPGEKETGEVELLFYGGIAVMTAAVIGGAVALAVLRLLGKRLNARLEEEYGMKRR